MSDGAATVVVKIFVGVRGDVASGKILLDPFQEFDIDRHEVFRLAVLRAIFHHPDLTIPLDDTGFDLSDFLVEQLCPVSGAADDRFASFFDALRTERIGLARPSKYRLGLLP